MGLKSSMAEKRKSQRLDIRIGIKYSLSAEKRQLLQDIFTKNISGNGIGLLLDHPLKIGQRLKVDMSFPGDLHPVTSVSTVVWCRKNEGRRGGGYDVGIKHLKISSKDRERFVFLFCETMMNYVLFPQKIFTDEKIPA